MFEKPLYTVYSLRLHQRVWITTDIIEITKFSMFMQMLGDAEAENITEHEIPEILAAY